jgi:antitoxin VapB
MTATAKIFTTGNSQAIRLPKAFRLQAREVWISKDEVSGVITLRPKQEDERKKNLDELFRLIREQPITEEFIPPRDDAHRPSPFEDEVAPAQVAAHKPANPAPAPKRVKRVKSSKRMAS